MNIEGAQFGKRTRKRDAWRLITATTKGAEMNTYYFFHGTLRIPGNPLPIYGVTRADSAIPPDEIYEKLVEQEATSRGLPIISIEIDTFNVVGMWKEPASIPPPPPPVQTEEKVDLKLPVVEPDKMERDQTYKK